MAQVGRPKAVTTKEVLDAIRRWKTTSPSDLAEKLNTSRWTIDRRLKKIPQEQINQIFEEIAESELKPAEIESYEVFKEIPIVQEYEDKMLHKLEVSEGVARSRCRCLWRICRILKRHPDHLTVEECADLIAKVKRKEIKIPSKRGLIPMGVENTKKTIRSFMQNMKGISGKLLKAEGVDASASAGTGKRARVRLTQEQREAFMRVLEDKVTTNWEGFIGKWKLTIPFADEPHLAQRMFVLPKAYYYWGNRKEAVLDAKIEDMQWGVKFGDYEFAVQDILDKGLHKKGRKLWHKDTTGELLQLLRELWEAIGKPKEGKWFPFTGAQVTALFKQCYVEAGIPEKVWKRMPVHIWRHTACQDMLDATKRNWDLVADRLGWESIDTMKKHYGKTSPDDLRRGQLEAMGYPVEWEKREFKF